MRVECDPSKDESNKRKHGLNLRDAADFDWSTAVIYEARSGRRLAIGIYGEKLHVVIYSNLGTEALSVISFRRAGKKERQLYHEQVST